MKHKLPIGIVLLLLIILNTQIISCKAKPTKEIVIQISSVAKNENVERETERTLSVIKSRLIAAKVFDKDNLITQVEGSENKYSLMIPEEADLELVTRLATTPCELAMWPVFNLYSNQMALDRMLKDSLLSDKIDWIWLRPDDSFFEGLVSVKDTTDVLTRLSQIYDHPVCFAWKNTPDRESGKMSLYSLSESVQYSPILSNDDIVDAKFEYNSSIQMGYITVKMNHVGTQRWRVETEVNIERNIAMLIDNKVYCTPSVKNRIDNGVAVISLDVSEQEAEEIAVMLQSGAIYQKVEVVNIEL